MHDPIRITPWEALAARAGTEIGVSAWMTITQARIDTFANLTGDHFFIHVDPERAAALPFGGTVAHGFLTLSLLSAMSYQVCPVVEGMHYALNYGFNRIRFVAPVPVNSRVRARFFLRKAEVVSAEQRQMTYDVTVEIEGADRPALVAEWITRFVM